MLPGIKFAERFADFGITGLAVSLFGAEGLPDSPDRIPLEMIEAAARLLRDKKTMTGHSVVTWRGKELPFVKPDLVKWETGKYCKNPVASYGVTGMWCAYDEAYRDEELVERAMLHPEASSSRILMIAGAMDEAWPSAESGAGKASVSYDPADRSDVSVFR